MKIFAEVTGLLAYASRKCGIGGVALFTYFTSNQEIELRGGRILLLFRRKLNEPTYYMEMLIEFHNVLVF